jgi:hypothetical protein
MQVLVRCEPIGSGTRGLIAWVERTVTDGLHGCDERITRVEVLLNDASAGRPAEAGLLRAAARPAAAQGCHIQVQGRGLAPLAARCEASTLDEAVVAALEQLGQALQRLQEPIS